MVGAFLESHPIAPIDRSSSDPHSHTHLLIAVMFFSIYLMYGLAYLPIIYVISQTFCTMSSVYSFLTYMFVVFCKCSLAPSDVMLRPGNI